MFGAIEAGGTKMVLAVGDDKANVIETTEIKTRTPRETIPEIMDFFRNSRIDGMGLGAFGPVCLDRNSVHYGRILKSTKLDWVGFSWMEAFGNANFPVVIDTDVNAACLGEVKYGNGKELKNVIYITIGTGIGVGVYSEGNLIHGALHPEAGHILLPVSSEDGFEGICPYHKNCFEGLASGPAIQAHYGKKPQLLLDNTSVWQQEADYIGKAIMQYICCYCPERIILGGGVMHIEKLFPMIREKTLSYLNGYIDTFLGNELEGTSVYRYKISDKTWEFVCKKKGFTPAGGACAWNGKLLFSVQ